MRKRILAVLTCGGLVVVIGLSQEVGDTSEAEPAVTASASPDDTPNTLVDLVNGLETAPETPSGYDREAFDYESSSTRRKVLAQERQPDGSWLSLWDEKTYTDASELDIDHTVALKEAWDSGASDWSAFKRHEFANDTSNPYTLNAITDNLNQSKGSDDGSWPAPENRCEYIRQVAVIKSLWKLSVDVEEKSVMLNVASGCRI